MSITTLEATRHVKHYIRQAGISTDEAIRRLCEALVEEGIGETILGSFDLEEVRTDVRVTDGNKMTGFGKHFSLDPNLSVEDIQRALGANVVNMGKSGDDKTQNEWRFKVNGEAAAIWDFRGVRWSAAGPMHVFGLLGLDIV